MRVLIVEDEVRLAQALARGLRADGCDVEVAYDGIAGQQLAQDSEFDVIVLDIMLPGRNGYQVCAALRTAGLRTPILMLTAKDGVYDETEAFETGADDYLRKPFSYPVLLARLAALARRSRAHTAPPETFSDDRQAPLHVGDLEVDRAAFRVMCAGVEVALTAKEFDILLLLAQRVGTAVTKRELLDELWDFADLPDANVVEVHVSALRRKLAAARRGASRAEPGAGADDQRSGSVTSSQTAVGHESNHPVAHIATVRGVGYRLDARRAES